MLSTDETALVFQLELDLVSSRRSTTSISRSSMRLHVSMSSSFYTSSALALIDISFSEMTEPVALIPIFKGSSRVVLVGDQ